MSHGMPGPCSRTLQPSADLPAASIGSHMDLAVQTRGDWELSWSAARWAEDRGLAAIALPDHYLERGDQTDGPAYDHLIHLAALARETSKIELVSLVSPVTFRHPAVFYKMAVTLDEISAGRFTMGVGTGGSTRSSRCSDSTIPTAALATRCSTSALPTSRPLSRRALALRRRALPAGSLRPAASSPQSAASGGRRWDQDDADPGRAVRRRVQHLRLQTRAIHEQARVG